MAKSPPKKKRFEYNLQSVLEYRLDCESKEQERFIRADQAYREELAKEEALKHQEMMAHQGLLEELAMGKIIDFQQIGMRRAHLEQLKVEIKEQVAVRIEAEEKKNEQHKVLIQAMKDRKILEEDKEKKHNLWKKMMKKEELKFLDEVATLGFVRKVKDA